MTKDEGKNIVYGQCLVCGTEQTIDLTNDEKATYRQLVNADADIDEYIETFPQFSKEKCAFLWCGICKDHAAKVLK